MKEIILKYDDTLDNWKTVFKNALDDAGIVNDDIMLNKILRSLNQTLITYLSSMGYRPNPTYSYRTGLAKRLKIHGLKVNIITNNIFWKYLEYFIDIDDYSKCFNINIDIDNIEVATKNMIFVAVDTDAPKGIVKQPIHCMEYTEIKNKLDFAKSLLDKSADEKQMKSILCDILDILDYVIRRID